MASAENQESICVCVNNFPDDVMIHKILPRLPAKSLSRFKCVSKLWLQAISDPKLAKTHLMLQTPGCITISRGSILHFTNSAADETQSYKLKLSDILSEVSLIPIKSCNGLLLLRKQPRDDCKLYIINPVTRRHINIPRAISPVTECFMHYDNVSNEYKLLAWDANLTQCPDAVYVLVLGDGRLENDISWRAFRQPPDLVIMRYQPVLFNGWYHWIVLQRKIRGQWAILALNIEVGEFKVMKVPYTDRVWNWNCWNYKLVTAEEYLYLVQYHSSGMSDYCYALFKLEDYEQQIWNEVDHYRVEYCDHESGWDSNTSSSTTLFDVRKIIERGPRYRNIVVHTNSLVWLDTKL